MAFPRLSVVAPGHDGSLIARPSRSGYDEIIPLGACLVIVINISVFDITSVMISLILCGFM